MTEESGKKSTVAEKLLIDDLSDFQFHAAYLKYSDAYDKTTDLIKNQLNQNIIGLQQNQIDYLISYKNMTQFLSEASPQHRYRQTPIKMQRKREWRRKTQKRLRNKRHRRQ